jgi:hypothetical protein
MYWKKILVGLTLFVVLVGLLGLPAPSYAQDYSFSVDTEVVDVRINYDGSVSLEYRFTFTCDRGAHAIDAVDVGVPNGSYSLSDVRADVDGAAITDIGQSPYVQPGVAVNLGAHTIQPGESGTVHVTISRVGGMVYEDSQDTNYASTEFSPTWFGSKYVHGITDMTVAFHLPEGVQPQEPRWHQSPGGWPPEPERSLDENGRVMYTWHNPSAEADRQYTFGASFPRQYVAESAVQKGPSALEQLFALISATISGIAGCVCNPTVIVIAIFAGSIALSTWNNSRRRMQYLPPSMKVEGVGIKRGLTAVEAAILLETPLNKVMTMILFGLLKKGAVTVLEDSPLKIQPNEPLPEGLQTYEKEFLEARKAGGTLNEGKLRPMTANLVKEVNNKMKGFSRKETMTYYQDIVQRAWQQVETAETPEVRSQHFDEAFEWTMLDKDFDDRVKRTFNTGPVFVPVWWGYHHPWAHAHSVPIATPSTVRPSTGGVSTGRVQLPTLPGAAFAAGIVTSVQTTASRIVGNLTNFTSGVTKVTNPVPKTSSSGRSYGGGGHSCACACACAGCACACAGGGR